jgi:hypothetical protein
MIRSYYVPYDDNEREDDDAEDDIDSSPSSLVQWEYLYVLNQLNLMRKIET